jgi:hypothetical protein
MTYGFFFFYKPEDFDLNDLSDCCLDLFYERGGSNRLFLADFSISYSESYVLLNISLALLNELF